MSAFDGCREEMHGLGRLATGAVTMPKRRRRHRAGDVLAFMVGIGIACAIVATLLFGE